MLAIIVLALAVLLAAALILDLRGWPLVVVELAAIGTMVLANRTFEPRFERWLQGAKGEESVGAILDALAEQGWHAIHDVSSGRGNIDHALVGPGGVFAVETKSHRGRISVDRLDPAMLKQAYAEKKFVEAITGLEVQSLLVFSEAYLIGRVPAKRRGVVVLPARMLAWYLSRRRPTMTAEQARDAHERLAVAIGQVPAPLG